MFKYLGFLIAMFGAGIIFDGDHLPQIITGILITLSGIAITNLKIDLTWWR